MRSSVASLVAVCILAQLSRAGESSSNSSSTTSEQPSSIDKDDSIQVNLKLTMLKPDCPRRTICINCGGDDGTMKCLGVGLDCHIDRKYLLTSLVVEGIW